MDQVEKFTVREILPADLPEYRELRLHGLRESPQAFCSTYEEEAGLSLELLKEKLAGASASGSNLLLGVFGPDSRLAGAAGLRFFQSPRTSHTVAFWGLYILPGFRRQGLARLLLTRALKESAARPGIERVKLEVLAPQDGESSCPALKLYESVGFQTYGLEERAQRIGSAFYKMIYMVKKVRGA